MKIVGYSWASISASDEDAEPVGRAKEIQQYMKRRKWEGPIQLEDESQAFEDFSDRPCGSNILEMLRAGDVLIVPDHGYLFSTAAQGIKTLSLLKQRHISVHSIDLGGDMIKEKTFDLILLILSPLKNIESKLPGERVKARKRNERKNGRYLGGNPPIGYAVTSDGGLKENGMKKGLIRKVLRLKANGMSLRKIATELQSSGIEISHMSVDKILKSAGYVGPKSRMLNRQNL